MLSYIYLVAILVDNFSQFITQSQLSWCNVSSLRYKYRRPHLNTVHAEEKPASLRFFLIITYFSTRLLFPVFPNEISLLYIYGMTSLSSLRQNYLPHTQSVMQRTENNSSTLVVWVELSLFSCRLKPYL